MRVKSSLVAIFIAVSLGESSFADDSPFHDDWVMRMQVEKLDRQFTYTGSSLDKVAKITVDYYNDDQSDKKTPYEMLWFNDGKPIGLERQNDLDIPAGKSSKIHVYNKKDTSPQSEKAIADAILRLSVDAYRKRFAVISVIVPPESYQGIVDAMHQLNCVESTVGPDQEETALMNFSIETENKGGPSTLLYYY